MTAQKTSNYTSLQILRGAAAWIVVFFHFNQVFYNHRIKNPVGEWISDYGDAGVDVFFVLSGFVMAATAGKYAGRGIEYGINRIVRIAPNYWFYTLLLVVSLYIFPDHYITSWNWSTLKDSLLFIPNLNPWGHGYYPTLYPGWTLVYEMFFYMLLACCLIIRNRYSLLICGLILAIMPVTPLQELVFLGRGYHQLWEFLAGMLIYRAHMEFGNSKLKLYCGVLIGLAWAIYAFMEGDDFYCRMLFSAFLVYLLISLEFLFRNNNALVRFMARLGDYSYSTYLAHIPVIGWAHYVFEVFLDRRWDGFVVAGMAVTTYLVSFVTYKTIETGWFPKILKICLSTICFPIIAIQKRLNNYISSAFSDRDTRSQHS